MQYYIKILFSYCFLQIILESFPIDDVHELLQKDETVKQFEMQMAVKNTVTTSNQHSSLTISNETTASASRAEVLSISNPLQDHSQQSSTLPFTQILLRSAANLNVFSVKFLHF